MIEGNAGWNAFKYAWSWLPSIMGVIGGFFGIALTLVNLYESRTFQHWKNNYLMKRKAKKLARLQRKALEIAAQIQAIRTVKEANKVAAAIVDDAAVVATAITTESAMHDTLELPSKA